MHDHILRRALGSSPIVQWLKLEDFINVDKWEQQPGDLDGIYNQIVLPELRTMRDPRVLDYWDLKLKKEADFHDLSYAEKRRKDRSFGRFVKSAKKNLRK